MLTSDREMDAALRVVGQVEGRFNRNYNYPWIFLNDRPFSQEFQRCERVLFFQSGVVLQSLTLCSLPSTNSRMSSIVSGPVHFAKIPDELWNHPPSVNWTMALERMEQMENDGIAKSGRIGSGFRLSFF